MNATETARRLLGRVVPRHSRVGDALRRWRHRLRRGSEPRPLESVVDAFAAAFPRATFVQVGANDGVRFDPIRRHVLARPWQGVLVEPLPHIFRRLEQVYAGHRRVRLANVAIADAPGTRPLYHLRDVPPAERRGLPDYYDALGSFRKEVVLSHRDAIPDIEDRLEVTPVPCTTFQALCEAHGIERLDLVHIDTEGYDFEIVKMIDLRRWRPAALLYEHLHLSDDDRQACLGLLAGHGYRPLSDLMDTLCIREDVLDRHPALARRWADVAAMRGDDGLVPWEAPRGPDRTEAQG